jgi:hypothetical protein
MYAVCSGRDKISLHRGSLMAMQEHWDGKYPGMKVSDNTISIKPLSNAKKLINDAVPLVFDHVLYVEPPGRHRKQCGYSIR